MNHQINSNKARQTHCFSFAYSTVDVTRCLHFKRSRDLDASVSVLAKEPENTQNEMNDFRNNYKSHVRQKLLHSILRLQKSRSSHRCEVTNTHVSFQQLRVTLDLIKIVKYMNNLQFFNVVFLHHAF